MLANHFKMYSSVALNMFVFLSNHYHYPSPECFHHFKLKLYCNPLFPPHMLYFLSLNLTILGISHKWNHTIFEFCV